MNRNRAEKQSIVDWIRILENENKEMKKEYSFFYKEIEALVFSVVNKYQTPNTEAVDVWRKVVPEEEKRLVRERAKEISSLTLTENAREELNHIQLDEKARVSEVVGTVIALENVRLFNKVEKRIFSVFDKTVTVELEKQAMINGLDRQYIKNHLDDAVRKGIQASNKKTTDLIWGKYKESMKYEVSQSIRESMLSGRNPRQLAEELKGLVGENEYFAERLMWTEQANVQGRSQVESYKAQGIVEYDFMVEPSACKVCKEVESQNPHLVSKAQEGVNLQAMHPNCRCSTVGVPL